MGGYLCWGGSSKRLSIDNYSNFDKLIVTILFATIGVAPKLVISAKAGGKHIEGLRKEAFALCEG